MVNYVLLQAVVLAMAVVLLLVNLKHSAGCLGARVSDEVMRRRALEHRLRLMEQEVRENSQVLNKFLAALLDDRSTSKTTRMRRDDPAEDSATIPPAEIVALKRACHADAVAIVAELAEAPTPPMPAFDTGFESSWGDPLGAVEGGGDDRGYGDDDVFGGRDPGGLGDLGAAGYGDGGARDAEPLPPMAERSATCKDWRANYGVSPGVSWGSLPFDLQERWRLYDCDIYLQESVQGILRQFDDDFNVIGDISSTD
eukprot:CAMPEP_0185695880 /NCGR_PEP_ID=MMETSP1164-20130828/4790_1 /TAXON_ID=1104430 /ORGANISM="Chrysoreinhardia sp, Strain CCMP2950" /LENGTH=254 /DNA_ID=CAMNT_0028362751 /DNA_START=137 /DNA_END=901 /DNA_ORIENTATION=+